jgi:hypothetical protein
MPDYLPTNDEEFDAWYKFMNQYVNLKCGGSTPEWTQVYFTLKWEIRREWRKSLERNTE